MGVKPKTNHSLKSEHFSYKDLFDNISRTVVDITDRKAIKEELFEILSFVEGVYKCSQVLAENKPNVLQKVVTCLQEISNVNRVYIFENFVDGKDIMCMKQINKVCDVNTKSEIDNPQLQHLSYIEFFPRWEDKLRRGNIVNGIVKDFSKTERNILEPLGILGVLIVPIFVGGKWWGFIGFDNTTKAEKWSENNIDFLKTISNMIGNYIDKKNTQKELQEKEERFRTIAEATFEGIIIVQDNKIIDANMAMLEMFGYSYDDIIDMPVENIFLEKRRKFALDILFKRENLPIVMSGVRKNKETIEIEVRLRKTIYKDKPAYVLVIRDITNIKRVIKNLRESELRYRTVFDNIHDGVSIYQRELGTCNHKLIDCNESYTEMSGYTKSELLAMDNICDIQIFCFDEERYQERQEQIERGESYSGIFSWKRPDGKENYIEYYADVLVFDEGILILNIDHDITEAKKTKEQLENMVAKQTNAFRIANERLKQEIEKHKKTEERLELSLNEKSILLKEIHHRVKNNLQIVSSILNLQCNYETNKEVITSLKEAQSRILTIALLHSRLYDSTISEDIDLFYYIQGILSQLKASYNSVQKSINFELIAEQIITNIDTAIYCGLIINELVTNSFKHSFDTKRGNIVFIEITKDNQGNIVFDISDNGVGIIKNTKLDKPDSLGMEIIIGLVQRMKGELKSNLQKGNAFRIRLQEKK